jgi:hypothetical protein
MANSQKKGGAVVSITVSLIAFAAIFGGGIIGVFILVAHIQGQVAAGQILKMQQTNKHALILCPLWSQDGRSSIA